MAESVAFDLYVNGECAERLTLAAGEAFGTEIGGTAVEIRRPTETGGESA